MTPAEIKDAIQIVHVKKPDVEVFKASLRFNAEGSMSLLYIPDGSAGDQIREHIKEQLRREIMLQIFGGQRMAVVNALLELQNGNPQDPGIILKCSEKIAKLYNY